MIIPTDDPDEDEIWAVYVAAQMGGVTYRDMSIAEKSTYLIGDRDVTKIMEILILRRWVGVHFKNTDEVAFYIREGAP